MLERLAQLLTRYSTRWVPDSFVIAALLTLLVAAVAAPVMTEPAWRLAVYWGDGFWSFIPFTLQMCMVILTGYMVADAPPVRRLLARLAAAPRTPRAAIALTALVSMGLAWLNWGLSIVASAMLARRIGRRGLGVDYRLLVATAYLGLGCMWHAGLSASAPLTSSDPTQKFVKEYFGAPVPITETILSPANLLLALAVLIVMTLVAVRLQPARGGGATLPPSTAGADDDDAVDAPAVPTTPAAPTTPAERLEHSPWLSLLLVLAIAIYLPAFVMRSGLAGVTINHVNLLFLGAGLLLHRTPASLLRSAERGGRFVWGVLLQFGLYAAVAGILEKSGLAARLADGFVDLATRETYPLVVVWYSGLVNYLVPSGGAKWFIEVQYLAEASTRLGVPLADTIVAYAWGDMLTDIIQPFWAIPLLAVARLGFRDIMGYCLVFFLVYAALVSAAFLAIGFF